MSNLSDDSIFSLNNERIDLCQRSNEVYPTVNIYIKEKFRKSTRNLSTRCLSYLPFLSWIHRYNFVWFINDLIAGLTVGAVVIPQGMAYAGLAKLPVQFGLYSSFMGVIVYWLFATSKDITIGPVAVVSLLLSNVITGIQDQHPNYQSNVIASALSLLSGCFISVIGLFRLGFLVDFISVPALSAFMTGSALTIAIGQMPVMMGNNKVVNTRQSTYLVLIDFFRNLNHSNYNAILGLSSLITLYLIRFFCEFGRKRFPRREKFFFFLSTLRVVLVIVLFLFISWLINRENANNPRTSILGTIPRGFQNISVPYIDKTLFNCLLPYLPSTIIVLLIEHIAIAKSFSRINNYSIDPNQELIAIGVSNILGPFFGGYPVTGSFSRTAIKSKAGVRTPLAGIFSGILIILGIYALTDLFFWISQASLAGCIIHAVGDLITTPSTCQFFWKGNPIEFIVFLLALLTTLFSSIENGIYLAIILSLIILVYRISQSQGSFIDRIEIIEKRKSTELFDDQQKRFIFIEFDKISHSKSTRKMSTMTNGIFIYRFHQSFLYLNGNNFVEQLREEIYSQTRKHQTNQNENLLDRPWNSKTIEQNQDQRSFLNGIILDLTGVEHIDVTAGQLIVDLRQQLDRYADKKVPWIFVGISNPWIKRTLISTGFIHSNSINTENQQTNSPIIDQNEKIFFFDLEQAYQSLISSLSLFR